MVVTPFPEIVANCKGPFFWGGSGTKHVIILIVTVNGKGYIDFIHQFFGDEWPLTWRLAQLIRKVVRVVL